VGLALLRQRLASLSGPVPAPSDVPEAHGAES
jgi:hypothetical protein